MSTWFITGASRGFGAEITQAALDRGHSVAATARNVEQIRERFPDAGDALLAIALDVLDPDQIERAIAATRAKFGGIDVLINNAGRGLLGAVEEASESEYRAMYEVNVFAPFAITRAVLPIMRSARSGTIVNISSIGGFASAVGFGIYCSTKFAIEGYTEALRQEVAPFGIIAGIVEPGYFRTDFLDGSSLSVSSEIADYEGGPVAEVRTIAASANHNQPGDPVKGAQTIVAAVDSGSFPERLFLGSDTLAGVGAKVDAVRAELERQQDSAAATDLTAVHAES